MSKYISLWDVAIGCAAVTMVTTCVCNCINKVSVASRKANTEYQITVKPQTKTTTKKKSKK